MKRTAFLLVLAAGAMSVCFAKTESFEGEYQRVNATQFEREQRMNESVSIIKNKDSEQYLVVFHSGYGDVTYPAQQNNDKLTLGDDILTIQKNKHILRVYSSDTPEVEYEFNQK